MPPAELGGEGLQPGHVTGDEDEVVAATGELAREGQTNAGGGAGHEGSAHRGHCGRPPRHRGVGCGQGTVNRPA
ncbi:MAG: hypothetical protein V9F04_08550 [Dermatophilaceae bacterium]